MYISIHDLVILVIAIVCIVLAIYSVAKSDSPFSAIGGLFIILIGAVLILVADKLI